MKLSRGCVRTWSRRICGPRITQTEIFSIGSIHCIAKLKTLRHRKKSLSIRLMEDQRGVVRIDGLPRSAQ